MISRWSIALCSVGILSGCASIVNGHTAKVEVITEPPGATVTIHSQDNAVQQTVTTPATVELPRGRSYMHRYNYEFSAAKPGYVTQTESMNAHVSGWYSVGNALFGGLIGWFAVDPTNGSMYAYNTDTIKITLPQGQASSGMSSSTANSSTANSSAASSSTASNASAANQASARALGVDTSSLHLGTWSYEIHKMATEEGCNGDGAWLISPPGVQPEAYREVCASGSSITVVCDSMHCTKQK